MALNYIWVAFFLIAFVVALVKLIFFGDTEVFSELVQSTFSSSKTAFEISLGLTGVLCLWLGIMKIGEDGGMVKILARWTAPFFRKLFPDIPKGHPVTGSILMNFSANLLGLDNAATPMGLKAMNELQELNPNKDTASDAQILFLVLNTSGLTLIPVNVMVYRAQMGAADPSDIFIPILLATFCSTLAGLIFTSFYQKINLMSKTIFISLGVAVLAIAGLIYYFSVISQDQVSVISSVASSLILFGLIIAFILLGLRKRINVYDSFIEGAKDGFGIAIKIIPFLVAILVGIGVFRASGAMDLMTEGIRMFVLLFTDHGEFVDALPTAFMKPLSGSGARGMMVEAMQTFGADSFTGRLASTFQGSTDTTFYVLALYFGSVKIKNTRHAVTCGLFADFIGIIASIFIAYMFFG